MKVELETRFKDIVNRIPKPKEKIEIKKALSNPFIFKEGISLEDKRDWAINLRRVIYDSYQKIVKKNKRLEKLFQEIPPTNNPEQIAVVQMGLMGAAGAVEAIERDLPTKSKQLFEKMLEILIVDKSERDTLKAAIKKFGKDNKNIEGEQKLFNAFCRPHINTVNSMIDNVENQLDANFPKTEAYEIIKRSLDNLELLTKKENDPYNSITTNTQGLIDWLTNEQLPKLDKEKALALGKWFLENKHHIIFPFDLYDKYPELDPEFDEVLAKSMKDARNDGGPMEYLNIDDKN